MTAPQAISYSPRTSIAATDVQDQLALKNVQMDGLQSKVKTTDVLTGEIVTTARRKLCARANDKMLKACAILVAPRLFLQQSSQTDAGQRRPSQTACKNNREQRRRTEGLL